MIVTISVIRPTAVS